MTKNNNDATGTRADWQGYSVARHILELAVAVPSAQSLLDQQYAQDLAMFRALASKAGIDPGLDYKNFFARNGCKPDTPD